MKRTDLFLPCLLCFSIVSFPSCHKSRDKPVVASVNGAPIFLTDLQKDLQIHDRRFDRTTGTAEAAEDQLRTMIDRKLMIEEALRLRLNESEHFEETLTAFREQILVRELIRTKAREWENKLIPGEKEIEREYRRMGYRAVIRATRVPDRNAAEELAQRIRRGEHNSCDMVGPCYYDEVRLTPLGAAFDMNVGDIRIEPSEAGFVVIFVEDKQKVSVPPLKQMRPQIIRSLSDQKQQEALADWLESVKRSAEITIDRNLLSRASGSE
jgi:parvulin-like peptidyl-prolyl isomerase